MSKIQSAVEFMLNIAADNSHGYSQQTRWGPDYDCSSLVISAWQQAGVPVKSSGATYTGNMRGVFLRCGFSDVTGQIDLGSGNGLQYGDVLLNIVNHTAMYVGGGKVVHARSSEGNTMLGDQSGNEIRVQGYWNYPWDCVLRYTGEAGENSGGSSGQTSETPTGSLLRKGMRGEAVRQMQELLIKAGEDCGPDGADGDFGNNTLDAVLSFQRKHNLDTDGIVGPATMKALEEAAASGGSQQPQQPDPPAEEKKEYTLGLTNEATIFNFCTEVLGLNTASACGVLSNIDEESGFRIGAIGDGGTSFGICQWHASRYSALRSWCASNGKEYTSLDGQLWYMKHELETTHSAVLKKLKAVADTEEGAYEAGYIWCSIFEVPANVVAKSASRGSLARSKYWPKYAGQTMAPTQSQQQDTQPAEDQEDGITVVDGVRVYTVKKGDTLWGIAQKYLGDGMKYSLIMGYNMMVSTWIYEGQQIKLPW